MQQLAIDKVKAINFSRTIDEADKLLIQALSKKVLLKSMQENNSKEVAITFKLGCKNDDEIEICFKNEQSEDVEPEALSCHLMHCLDEEINRDCCDCVTVIAQRDTSLYGLSVNDLYFFLRQDKLRILVEVTDRGACIYLEKRSDYDKLGALSLFNEVTTRYNGANNLKQKKDAVLLFINNCCKFGINYGMR